MQTYQVEVSISQQEDGLWRAEVPALPGCFVDAETLEEWRKDAVAQVEEAIAAAQLEPAPEGDKEDWCALSNRGLADQPESPE